MIDTNKIRNLVIDLQSIFNQQRSLVKRNTNCDFVTTSQLLKIDQKEQLYLEKVKLIIHYFNESITVYENMEARLMNLYFQGEVQPIHTQMHHFNVDFTYPKKLLSIPLIIKNGIKVGMDLEYSFLKYACGVYGEYTNAKANFDFIHFDLDGKANFQIFENKKIDPQLLLKAATEANVVDLKSNIGIKNDYVGVEWGNGISLFEANALAKAEIAKDKVAFDVDVGASIASAESILSFEILGIDIELTLQGKFGSVGAGLNYTLGASEIEFGGTISALYGGGFNVKIDY